MVNIITRLKVLEGHFKSLSDIRLARRPILLLMLQQAESIVRELKQELGYNEKSDKKIEAPKSQPTADYSFSPKTCCGKTFSSPQAWAGHLKSKAHRNDKS